MKYFYFCLISLLMSLSSVWADADSDRSDCFQNHFNDIKLAACTRLIESGVTDDLDRIYVNRAWAYTRQVPANGQGAIDDYTKAIDVNPASIDAYMYRGEYHYFLGENELALVDLNEAVRLAQTAEQEDIRVFMKRAQVHKELGNYDAALADCGTMKEESFGSSEFCFGTIYMRSGDPKKALSSFAAALESWPENFNALAARAWILATSPQDNLRDGKQAVLDAQRAFPYLEDAEFAEILAAAYAENGQFTRAVQMQLFAIAWVKEFGDEIDLPYYQERLDLYLSLKPYRDVE